MRVAGPSPNTGLHSLQNLHQPFQSVRVEIRADLDLSAAGQYDFQGTSRLAIFVLILPGQLHRHEPISHRWSELAPSSCFTVFTAPPFEVALQGGQRQVVIPAEFGRSRSARFEFNRQPLDFFTASSLPLQNFLVCCHRSIPTENPADEQVGMVRRLPSNRCVRETPWSFGDWTDLVEVSVI